MGKIMFPKINLDYVKGVLIDIDDTLYAYDPAHQKAMRACYSAFAADYRGQELTFNEFEASYRQKRDEVTERLSPQGCCRSRLFAFQALYEEMRIKQAYVAALKFENIYWDAFIDGMELSEEAGRFLRECRAGQIRVCAVSDMQAAFQVRKLQKLSVEHLIEYLVTSEEVGAEKPAPVIFETALKKLALTAREVIMIGDSAKKDAAGAEALGVKSYLVERGHD